MGFKSFSAETMEQVRRLTSSNAFKAGITTGTGLTAYNLEQYAKLAVPEFSPLRDEIPRVTPPGNLAGLQPNWRIITSFNSGHIKPWVSEGNRGALITYTNTPKSAAYVTQGMENNTTFESESAAIGFDNVDDLATLGLLNEFFAQEERSIIGGNVGNLLGQTDTPVLTLEATGGSLTNGSTYHVGVVALTYEGWDLASANSAVSQVVTQADAGPVSHNTTFNGGSAKLSALATMLTTGAGQSIVATVTAIPGAAGYAWFMSTAASAGTHQYFKGATTINSINLTTNPAGTEQDFQALTPAVDYSSNALSYDGLLSQTAQGGYVYQMPTGTVGVGGAGTGLTPAPSGAGVGIVEIDAMLKYFWDNYRTNIGEILVNAQEMNNITNKVLSAGSAPLIRFNYDASQIKAGQVVGGAVIGMYLNKYAMGGPQLIPIKLHPYMPAGTMLFRPLRLPYKITNIGTILRINARKDYYQLAWPLTTRKREWGIYNETVLQNYCPFAFGIINNIANA